MKSLSFLLAFFTAALLQAAWEPEASLSPRREYDLSEGWHSRLFPESQGPAANFSAESVDESAWTAVRLPHAWDGYAGFRQLRHGNLHGSAWYRLHLSVPASEKGRRLWLFFEGVSSYATVYVNGRLIGRHAGGQTSFTLDATKALRPGELNTIAVLAEHPSGIRDLPWVCGGCERAYGFSEGSQPLGMHHQARLISTASLRIAPFGIHVWNDKDISPDNATAHFTASILNPEGADRAAFLQAEIADSDGQVLASALLPLAIAGTKEVETGIQDLVVPHPKWWNVGQPVLYTLRTALLDARGQLLDRCETRFGFRTVDWPIGPTLARGTLLINGKPVFLNGTCEYPHLLGNSHAFGNAQIQARVSQIEAAGFNAFRDAHHPHDLRYSHAWEEDGLAWWSQFGAHVWYDTPEFRSNFKQLLREWIIERRNSPALLLWGLQNESQLPEGFAQECCALIRMLDPTASEQRLITTCNGGKGTDWDVPQNWTGTYGGNPADYAQDLGKMRLVGEYGAWRSLDLHEGSQAKNGYTEEAMTQLLETKLLLSRQAVHHAAGQFQWIFATHENPGRNFGAKGEQLADGWNEIDRVGPANNKGLLTLWGEPSDAYAMYRSHTTSALNGHAMVQIAGAGDLDRFFRHGTADVTVYSNAESVRLFDGSQALASLNRDGSDKAFVFKGLKAPSSGCLRAVAYVKGQAVAEDKVLTVLHPDTAALGLGTEPDTTGQPGALLRIHCGGDRFVDSHGNTWLADRDWRPGADWGAHSWAESEPGLPPRLASARWNPVLVSGTKDPELYQSYRYGGQGLSYEFHLPKGDYWVELHFAEPWYGRGGGLDAKGWRLFNIAFNGVLVERNLDLFAEAGFSRALVKHYRATVDTGTLVISFPQAASYQAVLCGIVLGRQSGAPAKQASPSSEAASDLVRFTDGSGLAVTDWLRNGAKLQPKGDEEWHELPPGLSGGLLISQEPGSSGGYRFLPSFDSEAYLLLPASHASLSQAWDTTELQVLAGKPGHTEAFKVWHRTLTKDTPVDIARQDPRQALVLVRTPLPAPAQGLRELTAEGLVDVSHWNLRGRLRLGVHPQGPSGPALTKLPAELIGADWLEQDQPHADLRAAFSVRSNDAVELSVAVEPGKIPSYLADWDPEGGEIMLGDHRLQLLRQRFNPEEVIHLGPPPGSPDSAVPLALFARLARPVIRYPLPKGVPTVALNAAKPEQGWAFTVGVGDRYTLVFRYRAPKGARLHFVMTDAKGTPYADKALELPASDDWRSLRVKTPTSINAGSYLAGLRCEAGSSLELGELLVQ